MISVVLVNWNGWKDTIDCIESLLGSDPVPARIIVIDNDSPNNSMHEFERWACTGAAGQDGGAPAGARASFGRYIEAEDRFVGLGSSPFTPGLMQVYFVASGRNGGFGFGCNVGMRLADTLGTSGYWLLNNDCVAEPAALSLMSEAITQRPDTVFGAVVRFSRPPYAVQAYGGGALSSLTGKGSLSTRWPLAKPLNYIYGASMCFSARVRAVVGDFDERIFMYYEEIDFCLRAGKAGIHCDVINTGVFHKQGGSQGGVSVNAWTNVLLNKRYVLHKHFGWGSWALVYFLSLLVRCVVPIGGRNASIGARRALKELLLGSGR